MEVSKLARMVKVPLKQLVVSCPNYVRLPARNIVLPKRMGTRLASKFMRQYLVPN